MKGVINTAQEKNFENRLKKYLDEYGCWWIKYWAGAAYTKSGVPDLLVSSDGCFLGIEVKAAHGEPSLLQLRNLKKSDNQEGMVSYFILRTLNSSKISMNTKQNLMFGILQTLKNRSNGK